MSGSKTTKCADMNSSEGYEVKTTGGREETDLLLCTIPTPPSAPPWETVSLIHAVYSQMTPPTDSIQTGLARKLWQIIDLHGEIHEALASQCHHQVLQSNARKANVRFKLEGLQEEYKNIRSGRAEAFERSCGNLDGIVEARKEMGRLWIAARKMRRDTRFWNVVTVPLNGMGREQRVRDADSAQEAAENSETYYATKMIAYKESIGQWREMFEKALLKADEIEKCEEELERQNRREQRWQGDSLMEMRWGGFWEVLRERMEEGWERGGEIDIWLKWCERWGCKDDEHSLSIESVTTQCDEMMVQLVHVRDKAHTHGKSGR